MAWRCHWGACKQALELPHEALSAARDLSSSENIPLGMAEQGSLLPPCVLTVLLEDIHSLLLLWYTLEVYWEKNVKQQELKQGTDLVEHQ